MFRLLMHMDNRIYDFHPKLTAWFWKVDNFVNGF